MSYTSSSATIRFLFGLRRVSPKLLSLMALTQVLFAVLTTTIAPLFVSKLLVDITNGSATLQSSAWLLAGYAVILFLGDVVAIRVSIAIAFIAETKMQSSAAKKVLRHLSAKSLDYHANRMTGGTVSDATKLNGSIERFWDTLMFTGVPIVTTILSVCIALSFIFWQYALVLFLLSLAVMALIVRAQSAIAPASRTVAEASSAMTAHLADVVSNIAAVKAFAQEENELKRFDSLIDIWRRANFGEMKKVLIMTGSFGMMMTILNIAAFFAAILATEHHLANVGVIYLVISYTLNVVMQLWSVSNVTRNYIRIIGDAGPMVAALAEPVEVHNSPRPEPSAITSGEITFDDVSFTHSESDDALFHHFSLHIPAGEHVGIVGHSGSGKTSLTRILLRFSDIDSGRISIDGQNIASITQQDLHRSIAYVPQEPMLFHRSLRENIAYGKPNATDKEIERAAKQANAWDFIKLLPHGLDTIVGERGVKLSGGQRQRVAIARAILKDAPILVLDEATSALDSESEKLIQDALKKLMKGRTSIVIAHRLSTISKLDRIVVLDQGTISEDGTHQALLKEGGTYAGLWSHQSGGFIDE